MWRTMELKFFNKKISGIVSVVPSHCVRFEDEMENYGFSKEKCLNLKQIMGLNERRIVKNDECGSDLVFHGLDYVISHGILRKEEIGALVLVTQTPDHFMPPTSFILQGKLGLDKDVLCFDINQGCTGYLYGLVQACMILNSIENKKVVLANCDTLSRRACPHDRNIFPLIGDAGTITVIENSDTPNDIRVHLKTDGTRSQWLIIPAGGFRKPSTEQTRQIRELPDGNRRSEDDFYMNGAGIFAFTQTDVPAAIREFFHSSPVSIDQIDYFIFHQPNRFMLEKLAKKIAVPLEKVPMNIVEKFGNSSSASIPLALCYNIRQTLLKESSSICMAGFGVGLSWGTLTMNIGPLQFCEILEK